jgi:hypothetical protein
MASKTDVRIGYQIHPDEHWQEIAAGNDCPPELIEQYRLFFNLANVLYDLGGSINNP